LKKVRKNVIFEKVRKKVCKNVCKFFRETTQKCHFRKVRKNLKTADIQDYHTLKNKSY